MITVLIGTRNVPEYIGSEMNHEEFQDQVLTRLERIEDRLLHEDSGLFARVKSMRSRIHVVVQRAKADRK